MERPQTILIIEDQKRERDALARLLRAERYQTFTASGATELQEHLDSAFDLVICDVRLGNESGLDVLKDLKKRCPTVPVIMVTAYGEVESAVAAMKLGAIDYLTKPLKPDELLLLLHRYLPMHHRCLSESNSATGGIELLVGQSQAMQLVLEQMRIVAQNDDAVLICGESGTGKELIANAIHDWSRRSALPLVSIDLEEFNATTIEQELFGSHDQSAEPSGKRRGRIVEANRGTLLIEEFFELPGRLQTRLVQTLRSKAPYGTSAATSSELDVRLLATTSRDLNDLQRGVSLAPDVYDWLTQRIIRIPSLRERPEDISILADHFLKDCAQRHLRQPPIVHPQLQAFFSAYEWPGNIRQLRNTIENMLVLGSHDGLTVEAITAFLSGHLSVEPKTFSREDLSLCELEKLAVMSALQRSMGNRTHAAQKLGISVRTLQRKMKQWRLDGHEQDG